MLGSIAVALAGRAASRLADGLIVPACRQVMLRLVMAVPEPEAASLRVLGVDLSGVLSHPSVTSASVA